MLLKEIRAIADEAVVLSPHDRAAEDVNTNWFGAPPHERMGMSVVEVVAVFEEVAEGLRARVAEAGHQGSATFYVWHDGAAGQLRCSISSAPRDRLPFGRRYQLTADLHPIVAEFLADGASSATVWGPGDANPIGDSAGARSAVAVWAHDLQVCRAGPDLPAGSTGVAQFGVRQATRNHLDA